MVFFVFLLRANLMGVGRTGGRLWRRVVFDSTRKWGMGRGAAGGIAPASQQIEDFAQTVAHRYHIGVGKPPDELGQALFRHGD